MTAAFDQFADQPRWVAWRNERRNDRTTRVPHSPAGGLAKANDPRTWGTRSEAEARARNLVNGEGGGIGIELGDLGDGTSLGGIDLDSHRAPDGNFEDWAQEIIERFGSYAEVSLGGTGAIIFLLIRTAELPALLCALSDARSGEKSGIINVYLKPDGSDRLRDRKGKTVTGRAGAAVVMLSAFEQPAMGLVLCEGVETGIALFQREMRLIWACGAAGTLANFPLLGGMEPLTIAADADMPGQRAADELANRWRIAEREVRSVPPEAGD